MADEQTDKPQNQQDDVSLEKLQQDLDEAINGWKRTQADFDNFRRRKEEEGKELVQFAREVTVAKLLPALDSLEQALKHMPDGKGLGSSGEGLEEFKKNYENWQNGANGIVMQLDKTLEELGVKKIEAVGKKFDPNFHEAVREVESDQEEGTVVEELMTGFELNGKVIRPSQVAISKRKL